MIVTNLPAFSTAALILTLFTAIIVQRARTFDIRVLWPMTALTIALATAFIDLYTGILPSFPDQQLYDQLAWNTVLAWNDGQLIPSGYPNLRTQVYATIAAVVYLFSGRSMFVPVVLNVSIWGVTVCYWLHLGKEAFDIESDFLGILLVLYPAGIIYSASFLREAVASFFLVLTLTQMYRFCSSFSLRFVVFTFVSFVPLALLRPETVPIFLVSGGVVLGFVLTENVPTAVKLTTVIVSGITAAGLVLLVDASGYINPFRVRFLEIKRQNLAEYSYSYLDGLSYDSWVDVFAYLPIRVFYFQFQPFPWNPANYHLTFATLDSSFAIVVTIFAVIGAIRYRHTLSYEQYLFILVAVLSIVGYALVVSTKGAVTRRRLLSMPILILFASLALPRIKLRLASIRSTEQVHNV
jgi:hypothetical protein